MAVPLSTVVSPERIAHLLAPFLPSGPAPPRLVSSLSVYLDLLLRWNARTNLTAVREPEAIVTRHFGESLFAASLIPPSARTLLDLGSGAGFPGLPIQLLHPDLTVTLAESQGKKAAFLREAIRTLALPTRVHAARAEMLTMSFDIVTLRAVDNTPAAFAAARSLATTGILALLGASDLKALPASAVLTAHPLPDSRERIAALLTPADLP